MNKYKVTFVDDEGKTVTTTIEGIHTARTLARKMFAAGRLVTFVNEKGIKLTI